MRDELPKTWRDRAPFAWATWATGNAAAPRGTDADGNTIDGKHIGLNTRGRSCTARRHLIVTLGLRHHLVHSDARWGQPHDEESVRELVRTGARWTGHL